MLRKPSAVLRIYVFINQSFQKAKEGDLCITTVQLACTFHHMMAGGLYSWCLLVGTSTAPTGVGPSRLLHVTCANALTVVQSAELCYARHSVAASQAAFPILSDVPPRTGYVLFILFFLTSQLQSMKSIVKYIVVFLLRSCAWSSPRNTDPEDSNWTLSRVTQKLNFKLKFLPWLTLTPIKGNSRVADDSLGTGLGPCSTDHLFLFLRGPQEATGLSDLT